MKRYYLRLAYRQGGGHTHVRLFSNISEATRPTLSKCGDVVMTNEEWREFRSLLQSASTTASIEFTEQHR